MFNEKEDIDSYIERFVRFASSQRWPKEEWAINLSALLTGKALEVYSRLPAEEANDFELLKAAVLTDISLQKKVSGSDLEKPQQNLARVHFSMLLD